MKRLLIANRGEIACRIARTARAHGITTIAVYTDVDRGALHTQVCDEALYLGEEGHGSPYLNIGLVVDAAVRAHADAVHPGYGFLSERAEFATAVLAAGLNWVGPSPEVMAALGRKDAAKTLARALGVPTVPGFEMTAQGLVVSTDPDTVAPDAATAAEALGYPLLVKAVAGGGGRGMRIVRRPEELQHSLEIAAREAKEAFGDGTLLCETYVERGRHIEVQILADRHGHVLHLGERECSIQRRHQKLIEESPSPGVTAALREAMTSAAVRLAAGVGYESAGTVEFLLDEATGHFYFLEVNTRLQVEHPVTEWVTGLDLVAWQLWIAQGQPLTLHQSEISFAGHAMEARLCAEDPARDFLPQAGPVACWEPAQGEGLRVDHGLHAVDNVPLHYDAMIAKVIAWGPDRAVAIARLAKALQQTRLAGIVSNRLFLAEILQQHDFRHGHLTTHYVKDHPLSTEPPLVPDGALLAAALWRHGPGLLARFRSNPSRPDITLLQSGDAQFHVALEPRGGRLFGWGISRVPDPLLWTLPGLTGEAELLEVTQDRIELLEGGRRARWLVAQGSASIYLQGLDGADFAFTEGTLLPAPKRQELPAGSVAAPGAAVVVAVHVAAGDSVEADAPLVTLEAMKMMTVVRAPAAGVVREVLAAVGDSVPAGTVLVELADA